MPSPFDLAVAQPILGQPSKKKWMPSLGFGECSNKAVSSSDWNVDISTASGTSTTTEGGSQPRQSSNEDEVVTATFDDSCDGSIKVAVCGGMGAGKQQPFSFGIDTPCVPPEAQWSSCLTLDGWTTNKKATSWVNITPEIFRRHYEWQSIASFDRSYAGMESLVHDVANHE
ncbi:hypothetical protein IV203_022068 [Nitzschia inconspicua]|uniref:Uncharacterized protein n=1 Tax=Nitzschia inconspicua TaxID=303405 RepID=A0A9K3KI16_9STRA|nr:hypothetical protein IV203_022068 [Nitzschia inconspicua]